jgi:hypothetical protein
MLISTGVMNSSTVVQGPKFSAGVFKKKLFGGPGTGGMNTARAGVGSNLNNTMMSPYPMNTSMGIGSDTERVNTSVNLGRNRISFTGG